VLDEIEEILVRTLADASGVGQVARTDEEQGRSPRAVALCTMALGAQDVVELLGPGSAWRRLRGVQQPGQSPGEGGDADEYHDEGEKGPG
jgi:hypothetical protein